MQPLLQRPWHGVADTLSPFLSRYRRAARRWLSALWCRFALLVMLLSVPLLPAGTAVAQERQLVVGSEVDFPPFATGAADSTPGGFTVELWQAVAQEMHLGHRFRVRPFDELLQDFRAGRIDVLINLAQSAKRAEFADFSVPNVVAYGAIFTRKSGPRPQSEQEAKERSILVLRGDLAHDYALANGYRNLVPTSDVASAMKLLAAGQHDGVLVSRLAGLMTLKELGLSEIEPLDEPIRGVVQRFSFAVRKGDSELLARINEGLALTRASGKTQAIYEKWFAPLDPRRPSLADLGRYLLPAGALVTLSFGLFLYQRRVSRQLAASADVLREQQGALSQAQQLARLGNWSWHREAAALQWSDEMRRLHDLPATDAVTRDAFLRTVHADDRAALSSRLDAALSAGQPFELEYRLLRPGGDERWVQHRAEAQGAGTGRVLGTVLDITLRKRSEALQSAQSALLEQIAEGRPLTPLLNAIVASLESQVPAAMGGVLLVDDAGTALTQPLGDNLPAAYREGLDGLRIGPTAGSCGTAVHRLEAVIVTDTATDPLWQDFRDFAASNGIRACWSQPIVGSNGKVLGTLSLSHRQPGAPGAEHLQLLATHAHIAALAIERRRVESEIQQANEQLESRVVERTAQLEAEVAERKRAEVDLRSAKEFAESAASAKSEFLANMSHEIRTPLHGVLGAMEMLGDTPLTGQQQRFIDTARTSANILLGVIDEILDFSRLEGGKLRIETIDFDLHRTVEDVTSVLAQRAHAKQVELACFIAPEVPQMVAGDPVRLRQILVNLVGNAIKFTERGEVVITCTGTLQPERGRPTLTVEVRDTGIGIPSDKQAQLFEPFMQADNSTSRKYGGSGLGLSISRRLIELMGGTIGFESEVGRGSRFWFELPLRPAHSRVQALRSTALAGTRVLVVDDNATNRVILHRYLTSWSAQSGSASGGDEALAKLQDSDQSGHPYDLVLMDLNMPGMDGYTLVRAMQADPSLASVPVIMLSSSMQDPSRMGGLRVDIWLDKPVRQSDLHDAIATVLGRRRAPPVAPPPRTASRFNGERVLLVEDNAVTRDLGVQMLRNQGFEVEVAETGAEAVAAVQQRPFDAVLMDIQMPGMDGYEATRLVRQWELATNRARVPILALTAHALPSDRERCLAAGMDDYIVKPYKAATVAAAVSRWLMPPGHRAIREAHPTVLDNERLQEVRSVMKEEFPSLMRAAATSLQQLGTEIRGLSPQKDAERLQDAVHRIKNTAGDVGAVRLHEMAGGIERLLADGGSGDDGLVHLDAEARAAASALLALTAAETTHAA